MDNAFIRFGILIFGVSITTRVVAGILFRDPVTVLFTMGVVTLITLPFAYYLSF